jgi:two-component system OmpR family response regulator
MSHLSLPKNKMTQTDHSRTRVLVVEDDADMAAIICDFLAANGGVRADHAQDATAALDICQRRTYDLLIVDHRIRGMDGIELLATIRRSRCNTPAIMISGDPAVADSVEAGGTAFLAKPFQMSRLLEEATKVLRAPS